MTSLDRAMRDRELNANNPEVVRRAVSSLFLHRLKLDKLLDGHSGCVNTLSWTLSGDTLLSGSDDLKIIMWDGATGRQRFSFEPGHRNNIFQAKAIPDLGDRTIVSCAADGQVRVSHLGEGGSVTKRKLAQHLGRAHKLALVPDQPCSFFSCGEDGDVRFFDLREDEGHPTAGLKMTVSALDAGRRGQPSPLDLNAVAVNPSRPWLFAVGGDDQYARIYDLRAMRNSAAASNTSNTSNTNGTSSAITTGGAARRPTLAAACQPLALMCPQHLNAPQHGGAHITCVVYSRTGELLTTYHNEDLFVFTPHTQQAATPSERRPQPARCDEESSSSEGDLDNDPLLGFKGNRPQHARRAGGPFSAAAAAAAAAALPSTSAGGGGGGGGVGTSGRLGEVSMRFTGHRNVQTVKGCNFFGASDEYVVSGSDCGHVFIWDKATGRLRQMMHGDPHVVNCLEPHPWQPLVLATSGIANDIKVWAPVSEEPQPPDPVWMAQVIARNERTPRVRPRAIPLPPDLLLQLFEQRSAAVRRRREEGTSEEEEEGGQRQRRQMSFDSADLLRQLLEAGSDEERGEDEDGEGGDDGSEDGMSDDDRGGGEGEEDGEGSGRVRGGGVAPEGSVPRQQQRAARGGSGSEGGEGSSSNGCESEEGAEGEEEEEDDDDDVPEWAVADDDEEGGGGGPESSPEYGQ
ncbi:hypothetical protein FOA52_004427 [Chlamydomonas sp. UWO 241]|nr:hypothetical protein FOA52_004427 [Chlamydomonas sp. UWO 241]